MMIEDYDLMAHARRAWLGWLRGREAQGIEPAADERRAAQALQSDTRLDSAVLMVWESTPEGDLGWVTALRWLLARVADDLLLPSIPEAERGRYLESRREAIQRTMGKLDATAVTS
jgi:hypothetical protein